ncbi:MAG: hypothetical protein WKG07_28015 [Hymenobacter sp.]
MENEAIVFDGIHFLHIFFFLMGKRYDLLARHFVELRPTPHRGRGDGPAAGPHAALWPGGGSG